MAAIFISLSEFAQRCESSGGVAATMRSFAEQMGVDIVVGMTANEGGKGSTLAKAGPGDGRKGFLLLPADPAAAPATSALQVALQGAPAGLPPKFLEGEAASLFINQGIASGGFGLDFHTPPECDVAPGGGEASAGLAVSALNKQITRKTMLPAILHFLNAHAQRGETVK